MTVDDANRIIAEYMGHDAYNLFKYPNCTVYSESLDALVPVLEKIGKDFDCYLCRDRNGDINGWVFYFQGCKIEHTADTLQEAACIATAKAIQELGGEGCE